MKSSLVYLLFIPFFILITSCGKYDEGPSLSLLSKKQRFTGTWELARFYIGENQIQITNKEEMTVNKNGTFTKSIIISTNSFNSNGNWEFSEDKESLLMKYSATTTETWMIKRLSNRQLFAEFQTPSSVYRYEYVKKNKD
ncbi:MAG: hypothetical protein CVU05_14170 [Bacteroidetes bacterium HGW-Bacteroidetes-21]|jgi:hypothetical protein|nr:MAG: hypothetical protein CVU05_14170 [Bacteroidetes bacterium HGW-Bacteroidetes-21]